MVSERLCEFSPTAAGSEERVTNIGRGPFYNDDAEQ